MRYKFTLLKDLPNHEKGTVFRCFGVEKHSTRAYGPAVPCYVIDDNGHCAYQEVGGILDNTAWFKKEIDEDALTSTACPKCGSARGVPFGIEWYNPDRESNECGVQYAVGMECVCGHKFILYGTEGGIRRMKNRLGTI